VVGRDPKERGVTPKFTALVPMKHESERVAGKNLRPFCGRPLFHWILETLAECRHVGTVLVNTDSEPIARDADRLFGVQVLERPPELLGHHVGINELIRYDVDHSEGEYYFQTHATNPLLRASTIDRAIEAFAASLAHDSLFSVTPRQTRFYWADGSAINHDPDNLVRTQDLPRVLEENSCIYVFTRSCFDAHVHRIGAAPMMFEIDPHEAVDIDEPIDFKVAESLMRLRLSR
jgi:CMP-N-acetylneuraminic acid synthetase